MECRHIKVLKYCEYKGVMKNYHCRVQNKYHASPLKSDWVIKFNIVANTFVGLHLFTKKSVKIADIAFILMYEFND